MQNNQKPTQVKGTFHTQANLSQALIAIIKKHYESLNSGAQMPPFVLEALSLMSHNIAAIVDSDLYSLEKWGKLSNLPLEVADIIQQALPAEKKEEEHE